MCVCIGEAVTVCLPRDVVVILIHENHRIAQRDGGRFLLHQYYRHNALSRGGVALMGIL